METRLCEDVVTPAEVAEALRVSPKTVREWYLRGSMPAPIRVGGTVRWRRREIVSWIDQSTYKPDRPA